MKKPLFAAVVTLSLLFAPAALAQVYPAGCVTVATGLSVGSRGSSVLSLQQFLISRNYPGSGSWMLTGYFGQATAAAVRDFQISQNLPQTGYVDANTAAAISRVSCGGVINPTYPTYPQNPTYPSYPYYGAPNITSLSQNTGVPGNVVTVYGTGFDSYNTVNFNGTTIPGTSTNGGTSLTFTVPTIAYNYGYTPAGTNVLLSVSNTRGTSNSMTFTVYGNQPTCGIYPYTTCNTCPNNIYGYNNNTYCPPINNLTSPTISYLSPANGPTGTMVTVYGSGFSQTNNTIRFGSGIISNLNSNDGHSVSFTVPTQLTGYGSQMVTLTSYPVSLTNSAGYVTNSTTFTVTGLGYGSAPTITSVSGPTNLAIGTQGTWTVYVGTQNNNYVTLSVNWGDNYANAALATPVQQIYGNGQQTNTLTHTYSQGGTYTITFTVSNQSGQTNAFTSTVYVSGTNPYNSTSVSIANMAFNPQTVYVQRGSTVMWTNNDAMTHTVSSDSGLFNSGTINPGATFSYSFVNSGTYSYYCAIHPNMRGTIVVQ